MALVTFTRAASQDLERIRDFATRGAWADPEVVLERIFECMGMLEHHPELGRPVGGGLRELVISHGRTGYLALYEYQPALDRAIVARIRHQREVGYPST